MTLENRARFKVITNPAISREEDKKIFANEYKANTLYEKLLKFKETQKHSTLSVEEFLKL